MAETVQDIFPTEFRNNYVKNFVAAVLSLGMSITLKTNIRKAAPEPQH